MIMDEGNVKMRRLQTELFVNDDTDPLADLFAQELVHSYTCGNREDIVAFFDMLGMEGTEFDKMLLDNRNYQMAEAIDSILGSSKDKKVMFAFGLAHWIVGDTTSLDVLLKERGYSLVHVPHWDEDDAVNFSNEVCGVEFNDDTELFQLMDDSVSSNVQVSTPDVSGGESTSEVASTEGPVNQESSELSDPGMDGNAEEPASVTSAATPAGFQRYVNPSCQDDPTYLYDSKYSCSDIGDGDLIEVCGEVLFETFLNASETGLSSTTSDAPRPDEFPTQKRLVVTVGSRYCPASCSAVPQCEAAWEHYKSMTEAGAEESVSDGLVAAESGPDAIKPASGDEEEDVVCEDDPSFLYKGKPGYDCAYIARELPDKCSKTHNGNLVGFLDCPVSCGMVDKCQVSVDEGEDDEDMWLDDDDWVWVEGSQFYEDDFAFDPFAGIHLKEEGFMQVMEDDAFEDLAFDPFTGTLEKEKKIEEGEAKLYVDGSMREHDVEILSDDLDMEENNETYLRIKKLEDKTIYHVCSVSKAVNGTDVVPVIYCTFYTPLGLPATAEIHDGECAPFTDEANSTYFTNGVAAAVHAPTLTDVEKRQGIFDQTYCARLDFVHEGQSVVQKRYLMQISYHYLVDKKSGEVQGLLGADVHDENRGVEKRNMAVAVGFGAFGGIILTLALVAMIFGKKRRQREVTEERNMYNISGKYPELVNAPSIEALNEAFRVGGSFDGGDAGGEDITDGDYEAIAAARETERREWEENELV